MVHPRREQLDNSYPNMQICKACLKEIKVGATKCSYCQAYQVWYKNPQSYNFLFMVPLIVFMFWNTGLLGKKEFSDYQSEFTLTIEKAIPAKNPKYVLVTYKVNNNTNHKWSDLRYQVVSKNKGEILASEANRDYSWVIQANSDSLLTARVEIVPNVNEWELKIKDLEVKRF